MDQSVYIVDGARAPFLKARSHIGPFSAADLAVGTGKVLMQCQSFEPSVIDEVVIGCTMPSPDEANIARIIALRLGLGHDVPAYTVQRNCASGMQAIDSAAKDIAMGRAELALAGGVDTMSRAPLVFNNKMANWLGKWMSSKTPVSKFQTLMALRLNQFVPIIALLKGLTDPVVGLSMGQTAENLAYRFGISRDEMDAFAVLSHQKLAKAQTENNLTEITAIYDKKGKVYKHDDGVRLDSSVEKLAKLKPYFDKRYGSVTAGNSSQITDGAALLILASEAAVKKHQLPILGKLVDTAWAALDPAEMGLGPVHASTKLLQKYNLKLDDIDYWEINEAFAAQVLGCIKAWEDKDYCKNHLGLNNTMGTLDQAKLNINGGAIALGHPIGATGARLALHLANVLKQKNAKRGIATLCIGGGQGGAMLIESVDKGAAL